MQLFHKGDIIQEHDGSQWEILEWRANANGNFYEIRSIKTGEIWYTAPHLLEKAIVIKFADPLLESEAPKCKVFYLADYRNKMVG